jgi:hypothetical protein
VEYLPPNGGISSHSPLPEHHMLSEGRVIALYLNERGKVPPWYEVSTPLLDVLWCPVSCRHAVG